MKKKVKNKYPLVEITWEDHWSQAGWHDPTKPLVPAEYKSVGYLIKKTRKEVVIVACLSTNRDFTEMGNMSYRLASCVKKIRYIEK